MRGVTGVMVPMVETAEAGGEHRRPGAAYRPQGRFAASRFGMAHDDYAGGNHIATMRARKTSARSSSR